MFELRKSKTGSLKRNKKGKGGGEDEPDFVAIAKQKHEAHERMRKEETKGAERKGGTVSNGSPASPSASGSNSLVKKAGSIIAFNNKNNSNGGGNNSNGSPSVVTTPYPSSNAPFPEVRLRHVNGPSSTTPTTSPQTSYPSHTPTTTALPTSSPPTPTVTTIKTSGIQSKPPPVNAVNGASPFKSGGGSGIYAPQHQQSTTQNSKRKCKSAFLGKESCY